MRVGEPASSGARGFSGWLVQTSGFSGRDERGGDLGGRRVTQRGEDSTTTCCEYIACYETPTSWNTRVKEGGKLVS